MAKAVALEWGAFMEGRIERKEKKKVGLLFKSTAGLHMFMVPSSVLAAGVNQSAWAKIFATVLTIADWTCLGVIVFAGATWMFGNRTKGLEHLIQGAIGYLIIRHATDIRDWLRSI